MICSDNSPVNNKSIMELKGLSTAEALQRLHDGIQEALLEEEDQTVIKYILKQLNTNLLYYYPPIFLDCLETIITQN